ncbi:MAG: aspartate aminotransferase family protein [Rhodospirillales bacterium]|nr:aspartate aminotransferase family protein [Rhodospirillales bacterium]
MARDLMTRDARTIADIERIRFFPATTVGGEGSYVIEADGRRVLDFSASWGAASLGYGHPAVAEAVSEAVGNMGAISLASCAVGQAVELAEDLFAHFPDGGERRVWFGHAGSDANDTVVRLIEAASPRRGILSFVGAYHGGSAASMSVSGHSSQAHAPARPGLTRLPYPDPYRPQFTPDLVAGALDDLDRRFESELEPDEIAAVFIEPIQSDGGVIVPPAGFLKGLEERCRAHGILIVVDEVKVGMGRTGLHHAFEAEGLSPDIVVYGKGLGGGLPISAVVGPAELMNLQPAFAIMTAAGNPVCAAAGRAVLRTIEEENLTANAARMGEHLMAGLARLAQRHALIGHVRGRGLTVGVELVRDPASKEPASTETAKVAFRAHRLGLVFYYVGMESNVLELTPPLNISEDEIDEGLAILDRALEDVAAGKVSDEEVAAFAGW